ncbi:EAL domain-containing protein [Vagococcus sp. WN89Y]|uniref:EAL domain-containing protein n=1 Tax=Vagococcus sp. WN89Y TaxID=3457258 RepID=UPI003FCD56E3
MRKFFFALILCLVTIPIARYLSPRAVVDSSEVYLAWLPLCIVIAILLIFGRHGILPLIISFALINEWYFNLHLVEGTVLLVCQLFPVFLVCGLMRWQMGRRWRHGVPNKNMGIRILWLCFLVPIGIKTAMYIAGVWFNYPVYLANFFSTDSIIYSIIDTQSLICSVLIFARVIYYLLRMIVGPRFARVFWQKTFVPVLSAKNRRFTLGWVATLAVMVLILCLPYKSDYVAGYLVPVIFIWFTLGINRLNLTFITLTWAITAFMLLAYNDNFLHGVHTDYSLAFVMSVLICFNVSILYMTRMFNRSEWLRQRWEAQALTDPLTGLPNLRAFEKELEERPSGIVCSIHMKNVEFLSRHFGLLMRVYVKQTITQDLKPLLMEGEKIYQLPGSELLLKLNESDTQARLHNIIDFLNSRHIFWHDFELDIEFGASWGELRGSGEALHQMLGQLSWLSEEASAEHQLLGLSHSLQVVTDQTTERVLLLNKVKRALDENGIALYGQPIVDRNGEGYQEILTRLVSDGELMTPDQFIPIIAQFNLSSRFDMQVVESLLRWMQAHPRPSDYARFSVNLMPMTIMSKDFVQQLLKLFERYSVTPKEVIIEITEEQVFSDSEANMRNIQQLRAAGFKIAIDDFGTGYSNFERLKQLQADIIKIDGCFVRDILQDAQDAMIVKAICELAKAKSLSVVAEYVENAEQRELLLRSGVDYLQGYLLGKPQPLPE